MTTRSFKFVQNEFYHIYNRGVEKRDIYLSKSDYARFKELLYLANGSNPIDMRAIRKDGKSSYEWDRGNPLVAIGAYCLMPNHFHLLVTPIQENGVALFMNKLGTGYSMYFNRKNDRTGALFEGKFKAKWVDSDEYLKYLYAYIHLNPVSLVQPKWKEEGVVNLNDAISFASSYQYSSLGNYLESSKSSTSAILLPTAFPEYFSNPNEHEDDLLEWLAYENG